MYSIRVNNLKNKILRKRTISFPLASLLIIFLLPSCIQHTESNQNLNEVPTQSSTVQRKFSIEEYRYPPKTSIDLSRRLKVRITSHKNGSLEQTSFALFEKGRKSPFISGRNVTPFLGQSLAAKVSPGTTSIIAVFKNSSGSEKKILKINKDDYLDIKL